MEKNDCLRVQVEASYFILYPEYEALVYAHVDLKQCCTVHYGLELTALWEFSMNPNNNQYSDIDSDE